MAERANYILKNGAQYEIFYTHWRAPFIVSDLLRGPKRFLSYVKSCVTKDELLKEPWIEGCVIVDKPAKILSFWSWDLPNISSVMAICVGEISEKWPGWQVSQLKRRMYDVEELLGIRYYHPEYFSEIEVCTKEEILTNQVNGWQTALIVLKEGDSLFIASVPNLNIIKAISYGEDILSLLKERTAIALPTESEQRDHECMVIDIPGKAIYLSQSVCELWEQAASRWPDYSCYMGDYGYLDTLKRASIDTTNLKMSHEQAIQLLSEFLENTHEINPAGIAKKLSGERKDISFHPNFFDTNRPE